MAEPDKKDDKKNVLEVHVYVHSQDNPEVLRILRKFESDGVKVAESPEVAAFRARVELALANVSADIQRLLDRNPGLSEEDKGVLSKIATDLENVASVVPEDPEPEADKRR